MGYGIFLSYQEVCVRIFDNQLLYTVIWLIRSVDTFVKV